MFIEEYKKVDSSLKVAEIKKIFNERVKRCDSVFRNVLVMGDLDLRKEF